MAKAKVYKIIELTGGVDRLVYASTNIDDAIHNAKTFLKYEPTIDEINRLKAFFKQKPTEEYTYTVNGRTVKMTLEYN